MLLLCTILAGCRFDTRSVDPVRYYDFGIPAPKEIDACCARRLGLDSVAYAPMLAGQTMWYREGGGSVEPRAFAISRWSAAPAALLEQHVRVSLGIGESDRRAPLPYQLSLKLETMEQVFGSGIASEARLTVSAALTRSSDSGLLDSQVFALTEAADQRSPSGGARALARLLAELNRELQRWTCEIIDEDIEQGAGTASCPSLGD